ncbi:MAG: MBL fold metallo-hydrolase [Candidatus Helarchaeota archaeon]
MRIYNKSGIHIHLNKTHILIDPLAYCESDVVLISHAHADHINLKVFEKFSQPVYLSAPTLEIIKERIKKSVFHNNNIHIIKNGELIQLEENTIQAVEAGHCIGSLQYKIQNGKKTIIYTGDFCIEPRMGMQRGTILKGKNSILITDSTYSDQKYDFPPRLTIYKEILRWVAAVFEKHDIAILFARKLGTSQELTDLINNSTLNCDLWVHPQIYYHNLIHSSYYPLGNFIYRRNPFDASLEDFTYTSNNHIKQKKIYLLPFFYYNKRYLPKLKKKYTREAMAICTGWATTLNFAIKSFALSSHADYKNIQHYFRESGATQIHYF